MRLFQISQRMKTQQGADNYKKKNETFSLMVIYLADEHVSKVCDDDEDDCYFFVFRFDM